ncbi:hypothetical protein QOZ80_6AG0545590 [Eleusine coracana subsp. coracana]|nr:hypothetical protein QOZ80_6AG0545590 [Eleusine coracana subsp. coracana]
MMHGRRTAVMPLMCLVFMALMLLHQDVQARKLLWTAQKDNQSHGPGSSGTVATSSTTPEQPYISGRGGSTGGADQGQQVQRDNTSKWAELHTDYIYTQDVKHNP